MAKARSNAVRRPLQAAVVSAAKKGLASVPFASGRARELAMDAGLTWAAFQTIPQTSDHGFTAADVRALLEVSDDAADAL